MTKTEPPIPSTLLDRQVSDWRKEISRLRDLVDHATGEHPTPDRCRHGVWAADHCCECEKPSPDLDSLIRKLEAEMLPTGDSDERYGWNIALIRPVAVVRQHESETIQVDGDNFTSTEHVQIGTELNLSSDSAHANMQAMHEAMEPVAGSESAVEPFSCDDLPLEDKLALKDELDGIAAELKGSEPSVEDVAINPTHAAAIMDTGSAAPKDSSAPIADRSCEIPDNGLTALEALTYLVSLKAHKDHFGKTAYYQQAQPRACERAIKALGNESMRKTERVSVDIDVASERIIKELGAGKANGSIHAKHLARYCAEAWGLKYVD